jgi:hypothetical protein
MRASAGQSGSSCEVDVLRPASIEGLLGPYGGPKATALLSNFLVDACELTLNQVVETVGRGRRMGIALDIMVSHLDAVDIARIFPDRYPNATSMPGCPATFPVYRANVDGFFVMSVDPAAAREQVNAQYERERASIHRRVAAVLSQFAGGPVVSEVGMLWHKIAGEHLLRADAEVAIDALTVKWDKGYIGDNFDLTISPFHQVVQGSPPLRLYYKDDQGYLATRFMVSSMYLALSSLGIRLIDRYILCHSIVRACEELFDVNATSAVQHMAYAVEMKPPAGRS